MFASSCIEKPTFENWSSLEIVSLNYTFLNEIGHILMLLCHYKMSTGRILFVSCRREGFLGALSYFQSKLEHCEQNDKPSEFR